MLYNEQQAGAYGLLALGNIRVYLKMRPQEDVSAERVQAQAYRNARQAFHFANAHLDLMERRAPKTFHVIRSAA